MSGVSSEHKDLAKFAEDIDPHLIWEELEDSLKKPKRRHYSLQALSPKTNYLHPSAKWKFHEIPKNDRPTKRPMAGCGQHPTVQFLKYMGRTEETIQ